MAVLFLWIIVQFVLLSSDLFKARCQLMSHSQSRLENEHDHMVRIHPDAWASPGSATQRAAESMSQPFLPPPQPSGCEHSGTGQRASD